MLLRYLMTRERLVLRIFLGIPLILWGVQKLTTPELAEVYVKDFQSLIFVEPKLFLVLAGVTQIVLGVAMIWGVYTRLIAAVFAFMGVITFVVPGFFTIGNPYKFAYGLVMAGSGLSLLLTGAGTPSWDAKQLRVNRLRNERASASNEFEKL